MNVKTVTVFGANGTMGTNISAVFASLGNAKVYMVARSLEKAEKAAEKARATIEDASLHANLVPKDFTNFEDLVKESDLIFESVGESFDIKSDIAKKIASCINKGTIIATGTSGLSITGLAEMYPEELRPYYMGMHFFNPPQIMRICEIIPTKYSDIPSVEALKEYSDKQLNRVVVEIKDEAAFLGNRVGFQFICECMQYAEKYAAKGGIDYIDAIMGPFTGRAMAPIMTADFVGLDTDKAIVDNIYDKTNDYARDTFVYPEYACKLTAEGKLGRKVGIGLYKSEKDAEGKRISYVYDIESGEFRLARKYDLPFAKQMSEQIKAGDFTAAAATLINDTTEEGKLSLSLIIKHVLYSLNTAKLVGDTIHASDHCMATGFNCCPPLALIDFLGGKEVFVNLAKTRLDADFLAKINLDEIVEGVCPSTYDFKKFFKIR